MSLSAPLSLHPAPSLEHLKESANSICLVKDCDFTFTEEGGGPNPVPKENRKFFCTLPVYLGEPLLQGPNKSGVSGRVASVSTCLQRMKTSGNESRRLFDLQLFEKDEQYFLCAELNERFVRKMRAILLAPFLTVEGYFQLGGARFVKKSFGNRIVLELSVHDNPKYFVIACFLKKASFYFGDLARENQCPGGKLNTITLGWHEPDGGRGGVKLSADSLLQNLLPESSKDLTIVAGNGAELKCHRSIFEAQSTVLAAMISPENGMKEGQTGRVEMKENTEDGVKQLLRYLYCVEVDTSKLNCEVALELFKTAHKYELYYLETCLHDLLLKKDTEWYGPDVIMELYFHVRNTEDWRKLRDHSLRVMARMTSKVRSCDRIKELSREEAEDLLWKLVGYKGTD